MTPLLTAWSAGRRTARCRRLRRRAALLAFLLLAAPAAALAAAARLVADLDPAAVTAGVGPKGFLAAGDRIVYCEEDPEERAPASLWTSDGTAAGTRLLAVLCPDCFGVLPLGSTGELAFFGAGVSQGNVPLLEVWRTDGTPGGTYAVASFPRPTDFLPAVYAIAGRYVYFVGCTASSCDLWSSDGNAALALDDLAGVGHVVGTLVPVGEDVYFLTDEPGRSGLYRASARSRSVVLVREVAAPSTWQLIAAGARLFFFANGDRCQLWSSDGTAAGTSAVTRFRRRRSSETCGPLAEAGARAWFAAAEGGSGEQLWVSDGTVAGTRQATALRTRDWRGAVRQFRTDQMAMIGGRLLFAAGARLWTTSGDWRTAARLSGCPGGCPDVAGAAAFAPLGGRVVFASRERASDGRIVGDPWISDGTGAGTSRIRDLDALQLRAFTASNGRVFFEEFHGVGREGFLWVTDGSAAGTLRLGAGRSEGPDDAIDDAAPYPLGSAGGRTFWAARQGDAVALFATGAGGGATLVAEQPRHGIGSRARPLGTVGERVLFLGCRSATSRLWSVTSDGAAEEIVRAQAPDFCFDNEVGSPLSTAGGAVFWESFDAVQGRPARLWRTDGTALGTTLLSPPGALPLPPAAFRGEALFPMKLAGGTGWSLWSSDGTPAGTRRLVELPQWVSEIESLLTVAGNLAYFIAIERNGPSWGAQLWRTDGTGGGTFPLQEVSGYESLVAVRDRLFFGLGTVWVSDGTVAGTRPVTAPGVSVVEPLEAAGGRVWSLAQDGALDETATLWVSDGTPAGTRLLPAALSRQWGPSPRFRFAALGDVVYFEAIDAEHGRELWRSDGTVEGTQRVVDLFPGPADGRPWFLTAASGRLWFAASAPAHGRELWSSDGTAAGTRLEADLATGPFWSSPAELEALGGRLYFNADDGPHGREPWVVELVP